MPERTADVWVREWPTGTIFYPTTQRGRSWIGESFDPDTVQDERGGWCVNTEHAPPIIAAMKAAGLEVRDVVLSHPGRYRVVEDNLRVKEVKVEDRRYIVCLNPDEEAKDKADRELILETLQEKLTRGAKALVGNRGFRRYLRVEKGAVRVDRRKVEEEARYDGRWVLRTNTNLPAGEVALQYKRLLTVERFFREAKDLLETRPVFRKYASDDLRAHLRGTSSVRGSGRRVTRWSGETCCVIWPRYGKARSVTGGRTTSCGPRSRA